MSLQEERFCYVSTRGRRSKRTHQIEIWFALEGTTAYILAGSGEWSDTVRNLRAHDRCTVRIGNQTFGARGRVVEDEQEATRARASVVRKYSNEGGLDAWAMTALPIALDLDDVTLS